MDQGLPLSKAFQPPEEEEMPEEILSPPVPPQEEGVEGQIHEDTAAGIILSEDAPVVGEAAVAPPRKRRRLANGSSKEEKPATIECQECNEQNPIRRLKCKNCGYQIRKPVGKGKSTLTRMKEASARLCRRAHVDNIDMFVLCVNRDTKQEDTMLRGFASGTTGAGMELCAKFKNIGGLVDAMKRKANDNFTPEESIAVNLFDCFTNMHPSADKSTGSLFFQLSESQKESAGLVAGSLAMPMNDLIAIEPTAAPELQAVAPPPAPLDDEEEEIEDMRPDLAHQQQMQYQQMQQQQMQQQYQQQMLHQMQHPMHHEQHQLQEQEHDEPPPPEALPEALEEE